jgi:hypothetical protein
MLGLKGLASSRMQGSGGAPPPSWLIRFRVSLSNLPTSATRSLSKGRGVSDAPIRTANNADWCSDSTVHGCKSTTVFEYARRHRSALALSSMLRVRKAAAPCLALRLWQSGCHPPARPHLRPCLWCWASARDAPHQCAAQSGAARLRGPASAPTKPVTMLSPRLLAGCQFAGSPARTEPRLSRHVVILR